LLSICRNESNSIPNLLSSLMAPAGPVSAKVIDLIIRIAEDDKTLTKDELLRCLQEIGVGVHEIELKFKDIGSLLSDLRNIQGAVWI
jgi:hypothetical protein